MQAVDTEVNICRSFSDTAGASDGVNLPFKPVHRSRKVHRAQFKEETNPRDHAKTGSAQPEDAGRQVFVPKMNKAEAQLNRVGSSAETGSSETRAVSVHRRVAKPWAERSTSREESADKDSCKQS